MMEAVDKADSAQYSRDDILDPKGWVLLNYLMDAAYRPGRFREFRVSNYTLMMDLIKHCRDHSIEQILQLPDVAERIELYRDHESKAREQIQRCSTMYGTTVVLDLRNEETIFATNRFMIYALFPQAKVSIHADVGLAETEHRSGHRQVDFNRSSRANIGELMLKYGGGGHQVAGTCQVDNAKADTLLQEIVAQINAAETCLTGAESGLMSDDRNSLPAPNAEEAQLIQRYCRSLLQQRLSEVAQLCGITQASTLDAFQREIGAAHDELVSLDVQSGAERTSGLTASRISLVGDEELELEIRIDEITARLQSNEEIGFWRVQLRYMTSAAPGDASDDNPLGLELIVNRGLWALCREESGLNAEQNMILLDKLEEIQRLPDLYSELNGLLEHHRVEAAQA